MAVGAGWWWARWYNDFDIDLTQLAPDSTNAVTPCRIAKSHHARVALIDGDSDCAVTMLWLCDVAVCGAFVLCVLWRCAVRPGVLIGALSGAHLQCQNRGPSSMTIHSFMTHPYILMTHPNP